MKSSESNLRRIVRRFRKRPLPSRIVIPAGRHCPRYGLCRLRPRHRRGARPCIPHPIPSPIAAPHRRTPSSRPVAAPCALELLKIFVFLYNPLKRSLCSFVLKPTAPLPVAARSAGYALLILRSFVRPLQGRIIRYALPRDSLALIPRLSMLRPTSRVVALAPLRWLRPGGCAAEKVLI